MAGLLTFYQLNVITIFRRCRHCILNRLCCPDYVNVIPLPGPLGGPAPLWTLHPRGSSCVGAIMHGLSFFIPIVTGTPPGDPPDLFDVIVFGDPYLIEFETHTLDNITYTSLGFPVFCAQAR